MFELLKHFVSEHAFQEDQGESAPNDNKCKWDKCNVEFLQKKILLQKHLIKQHTGQESDIFFYKIFNSRPSNSSRHSLKANTLPSTCY